MYFFPSPLHLQINLNLQYFCGFSCSLGLASVRPPHRVCRVRLKMKHKYTMFHLLNTLIINVLKLNNET